MESQDAMGQMDRRSVVGQLLMKMSANTFKNSPKGQSSSSRVKSVGSELPAAKETRATEYDFYPKQCIRAVWRLVPYSKHV